LVALVGMKKCQGTDHLVQTLAEVEKVGGEGLMLRKPKSKYEYLDYNI
jgi:DNA ligase-1